MFDSPSSVLHSSLVVFKRLIGLSVTTQQSETTQVSYQASVLDSSSPQKQTLPMKV